MKRFQKHKVKKSSHKKFPKKLPGKFHARRQDNRNVILDPIIIARRTMVEYGFLAEFNSKVVKEAAQISETPNTGANEENIKDMRDLLWSSIDNHDSLDLDQIEFCQRRENGDVRVRVAIADVDAFVPKGSAVDEHAATNGTSVYTGVQTFPMLPERLSTNLSSLKEGVDRLAVVIEYTVRPDGSLRAGTVYRAWVHNQAKLVYEIIGDWLEEKTSVPEKVSEIPGLEEQIRLQDEVTQRLYEARKKAGALELEMAEVNPVMDDGTIVDLSLRRKTRAHAIIENFMIAANGTMVRFLQDKGSPTIQRVVRTPERWPRIVQIAEGLGEYLPPEPNPKALSNFMDHRKQVDPARFPDLSLSVVKLLGRGEYEVAYPDLPHEGHFGLAVHDYTHSTAPNRRYIDLVIQRLLKAVLNKQPEAYRKTELKSIAMWCTDRDQMAKKVERFMRKVAAAILMRGRIGEIFDGIITGASDRGTYVRLLDPPVEGRVVRGEMGLDVGEKVKVRLINMVPERGFIDFSRVGGQPY